MSPRDIVPKIETKNVGVRFPVGMLKEVEEILQKDQLYLSVQEFVRMATKREIERWHKEHALGGGSFREREK